jgi:ABC-type uncharacterized transport system permease subunit
MVPLHNVTLACFGLSYLLALALELAQLWQPRRVLRLVGLFWAAAGLVAHSAFLLVQHPSPALAAGAFLGVAWVLAIFATYGTLHHARQAWGVFVWPLVLGLLALSLLHDDAPPESMPTWLLGERFWGMVHGAFLLFAAVGISVGFLASVMYLEQARRLKAKLNPLGGMKMLSLERLEAMNRRGVNLAFPLLSVGLLLGVVLLRHGHDFLDNLASVKVLGTLGLWVVFGVLVYLRYATTVSGRRLAVLTILAFLVMVLVLAATHPFAQQLAGGDR